ncbi:MAG: SMC-Scp complex subunit ScpB [Bdellovibrionales bacterium]|nr:SMC-Scp complex subunit ScpB [Bdellovibrionales bacterium]
MSEHEQEQESEEQTLEEVQAEDTASEEGEQAQEAIDEEDAPDVQIDEEDSVAAVEAVLFAFGEPMPTSRLCDATGLSPEIIKNALETLEMKYETEESGIELVHVGSKVQIRTKAQFAPCIRKLKAGKPKKLTPAALETLAVIAYRQPVVRSDIEKIRGVDPSPTIKTLLERKLVKIVGHQATIGQPALYGTTDDFMKLFGLSSLTELPSLRDIREYEEEPGEAGEQSPEVDSMELEADEDSAAAQDAPEEVVTH